MITSTSTTDFLVAQGLPGADLHALPESTKRFPDGALYLKFGLSNAPDIYPSGSHLAATASALSRERVRRARLGLELLARSGYLARGSQPEPADLAVPQC